MKQYLALGLVCAIGLGCGSDSEGDDSNENNGGSQEDGWKFDYTGDREGSVEGTILVRLDNMLTLSGGTRGNTEGNRFSFRTDLAKGETGERAATSFSLFFEGGEECRPVVTETEVTANVTKNEEDLFEATFSGEIECDTNMDRLTITGEAFER